MKPLDRRQFCYSLGAAALATRAGLAATGRSRKPNIVFILCDDLGWGDIDAYNSHSAIPTPHANALARQGMRFTDMHASSAVCTPSRYSILTGRYCWRSRLKQGVLEGYDPNLIEPGRLTVAAMLQSAGYYTAGVGKWHLGLGPGPGKTDYSQPLRPGPITHGFDYFYGIPSSLDFPPYLFFENDHVVEPATEKIAGSSQPRGVYWREGLKAPHLEFKNVLPHLTEKAVSLVEKCAAKPEQPFFLYFAMPSPHTPWVPLPEYIGKSRAGLYGDYVMEVDAMMGRVVDVLDKAGLADDTLLIFTSDNGADWKPEDIARYPHRANAWWRGEKADVWEAGHRVPLIARWPGVVRANTVSNEMASLTDFIATVAAILNQPLPRDAAEDSFNILPALKQTNTQPIRHDIIDHSIDGMFTIREGSWKLELGLGSGGFSAPAHVDPAPGGPKGQLYNLADDPREENNVYLEHPEIVAHLTALLEKYQQQGYSRPM
jgi:arylsulfatase A-like enzyme